MIDIGVKDANGDARRDARLSYHAYKKIFEDKANVFYNTMDGNIQQQVGKEINKYNDLYSNNRIELK